MHRIKYIILIALVFIPSIAHGSILGTQQGGTGIGGSAPYSVGDLLWASGVTTLSKQGIGSPGDCLKVAPGGTSYQFGTCGWATTSANYYASLFNAWKVDSNGFLVPTTTRMVYLPDQSTTLRFAGTGDQPALIDLSDGNVSYDYFLGRTSNANSGIGRDAMSINVDTNAALLVSSTGYVPLFYINGGSKEARFYGDLQIDGVVNGLSTGTFTGLISPSLSSTGDITFTANAGSGNVIFTSNQVQFPSGSISSPSISFPSSGVSLYGGANSLVVTSGGSNNLTITTSGANAQLDIGDGGSGGVGTLILRGIADGCLAASSQTITSTGLPCDYYNTNFRDWNIVSGYLTPTTTIGILVNASSTISSLTVPYGTTTYATSTNLYTATASTTNFFGAGLTTCNGASNALTWASGKFGCNSITASSGNWATTSEQYFWSQFRDWSVQGTTAYLAPTSTIGLLVNAASSTITNLVAVNGTTTNATTTNLFSTTASSTNLFTSKLGIATSSPYGLLSIDYRNITIPPLVVASSSVTLLQFTNTGSLIVGTGTAPTLTNGFFQVIGDANTTVQMNIQNRSNQNNASSDWVATADIGNDSKYYFNGGINNSGYNQAAFNSQNALDGYLVTSDGALVLGTASTTNTIADVRFAVGGTASSSIKMIIKPTGYVGISTTSPAWPLSVAGTTTASSFIATSTTEVSSFRQLLANASTTLQNFTGLLATTTSATTTNLFSTTASSTNLFTAKLAVASTTAPANVGAVFATSTVIYGGQVANYIASTTASATQVVNWSTGNTQRIMLTANTQIVVNATSSNPIDGGKYVLKICQDPTGSRTVTFFPNALRWPTLGATPGATTTVSSAANSCTFIGMIYDALYGVYSVMGSTTGVKIN